MIEAHPGKYLTLKWLLIYEPCFEYELTPVLMVASAVDIIMEWHGSDIGLGATPVML